jgi:hypothetical protein
MIGRIYSSFKAGGLLHHPMIDRLPRFSAGPVDLPPYVDVRYLCIPASDQGQTSKCAAYATAGKGESLEYQRRHIYQQKDPNPVYARAKEIDGHPNDDGTDLISVVRAGKDIGVIPENLIETVTFDLDDLPTALLDGPQIVGMEITDEHNDCDPVTGRIAAYSDPKQIGGHAVLCNFFDVDGGEGFGWQGSWGERWGCQNPRFRGMGRMSLAQARKQFRYAVILRRP